MKKIVGLVSAVLMATAYAVQRPTPPTLDELKVRIEQVKVVATTNLVAAQRLAGNSTSALRNERAYPGTEVDTYCAEVDAALVALGLVGADWAHTYAKTRFPLIDAAAYEKTGLATNAPYIVSLGQKYGCGSSVPGVSQSCTFAELIGLLNENLNLVDGRCRRQYDYGTIERLRKAIQTAGVRVTKKYLVSQGKSFVTKDGVNPCEGIMTELNTALNAPYFEGLNAWLTKMGVAASIDVSKLPTAAAVQQLRTDILNADHDMVRTDEFILKVCLGVDGYNAFVKRYNGEQ